MKNVVNCRFLWIIMFCQLFLSCSKSILHDLDSKEGQVYLTGRDINAVFSQFKTFGLVDSILFYRNNNVRMQLETDDSMLLQAIEQNMSKRGFTKVSRSSAPDLGINVIKIDKQSSGISIEPISGGWANLPGYWSSVYWGFNGGYDFPANFYVLNTREETVIIDLLDLKIPPFNNDRIRVIWNAQFRGPGVMEGENAAAGITEAFNQSPYLKTP